MHYQKTKKDKYKVLIVSKLEKKKKFSGEVTTKRWASAVGGCGGLFVHIIWYNIC